MIDPSYLADLKDKTNKDFFGCGLAAYAMMSALLTGMVKAGQQDEVKSIIATAKAWLSRDGFRQSSNVRLALRCMEDVEKTVELLAMTPTGPTQ